MKSSRIAIGVAVLAAASLRCSTSGGGSSADAANPMANFSSMITGTFRGSTPGNELTLDIRIVGVPTSTNAFDLFVTASGSYQGRNVRETGLLRAENQGRHVGLTYIPHFDPTVSGMSNEATRFTPEEIRSACGFYLDPRGDGYGGETQGSTSCAMAIHGATGKWTLEVEPGMLRLRNVESGETLRFQRAVR
jgi:hypothetical protein